MFFASVNMIMHQDNKQKHSFRKELVMMETTIYNFHTSFYISAIQKLAFHIPHVQILGTNHCGDSHRTAFKRRKSFQHVLCHSDYAERVVYSLPHKIQ